MIEEDYDDYVYDENGEIEYYAVRPNKTQIKKDIAALFALGEELSKLQPAQLKTIDLPEIIDNAVKQVAGMPPTGARKRLLKYIAGQLHKIDAEPFKERLARIKNTSAHVVREHHTLERWRDRLLTEGDEALTDFLDEQPLADRQQLRQLVRNAQKEMAANKPPKSSRLLYRYLKDTIVFDQPAEDFDDDGEDFEEDDSEEQTDD